MNALARTTPNGAPTPVTLGLAALMRHAYAGGDLNPLAAQLAERLARRPDDTAAQMDLSTILLLGGERVRALELQAQALDLDRVFGVAGRQGLRLLAILTPGDLMANTPLGFLIETADIELTLAYVDVDGALPADLPEHDVAFLAIGESPTTAATLAGVATWLADLPTPVLNGRPERIARLTRDGVAERLSGVAGLVAPPTRRLSRDAFAREVSSADAAYPVVVRPCGAHAGEGFDKIEGADAAEAYLRARGADAFFVAPFVDYRSSDGRYRKYRVVFIDGAPFICHLAVSDHWMVHYLSAGMAADPERRAEEAAAMASFDAVFCRRHAAALARLTEAIGLDYFGIDCAETRDGRLLVFEADVAMIVHALDDPALFAYKQPVMRKAFDAFDALLHRAAHAR